MQRFILLVAILLIFSTAPANVAGQTTNAAPPADALYTAQK